MEQAKLEPVDMDVEFGLGDCYADSCPFVGSLVGMIGVEQGFVVFDGDLEGTGIDLDLHSRLTMVFADREIGPNMSVSGIAGHSAVVLE